MFCDDSLGCFYFCFVARQVKPQFMSLHVSLRMSVPLRRHVTAVCGPRQRANTTHGWLPWLQHCPARHRHASVRTTKTGHRAMGGATCLDRRGEH